MVLSSVLAITTSTGSSVPFSKSSSSSMLTGEVKEANMTFPPSSIIGDMMEYLPDDPVIAISELSLPKVFPDCIVERLRQLLKNEEEKYEIDNNLISLKSAIQLIDKSKKLNHPLVVKMLSNIYTTEVVGIMMRSVHSEVAKVIVLPRLKQKLAELLRRRSKF